MSPLTPQMNRLVLVISSSCFKPITVISVRSGPRIGISVLNRLIIEQREASAVPKTVTRLKAIILATDSPLRKRMIPNGNVIIATKTPIAQAKSKMPGSGVAEISMSIVSTMPVMFLFTPLAAPSGDRQKQ